MPFPSSPQYTAYANYIIYFSNPEDYDIAIGLAGGSNLVNINPAEAASIFGITFPPVGGPLSEDKGLIAIAPWSFAEPGTQVNHPLPSGVFLSPSVDSVLVPGQAGNPASIWPAGPAMLLIWTALIMRSQGEAPLTETGLLVNIPQRRWICGFENPPTGEGPGFSAIVGCRDSSRTLDGLGWALRNDANVFWSRAINIYDASLQSNQSWERFYIRLRTLPNIEVIIWNSHGFPTATSGGRLSITTSGEIKIYNVNGGVATLLGTTGALGLNIWHKIDVLVTYNNSAGTGHAGGGASVVGTLASQTNIGLDVGPGSIGSITGPGITSLVAVSVTKAGNDSIFFDGMTVLDDVLAAVANKTWSTTNSGAGGQLRLYIDGIGVFSQNITAIMGGLGTASQRHISSTLGTEGMGAWVGEIDFDTWTNSAIPEGPDFPASLDSFIGSHVHKVHATAFASDMSGWAGVGGFNVLNQMDNPIAVTATGKLTSSTSGARLSVITDENLEDDFSGIYLGPLSVLITIYASKGGAPNGTLGYSIAAGAAVMTTIVQPGAATWNTVMYRPSGMLEPIDISPLNIIYDKAADATLSTATALQAIVERIGSWGVEDDPESLPALSLIHNAYYPNTEWAFNGPVPDGPVSTTGGLYTGNGTFQSINLPGPVHFLWIRPLTGGTTGIKWFGAGIGGHAAGQEQVMPEFVVRVFTDDTGQTKFIVAGNHTQVNANTIVYQYIAFSDPGMRFNICGAFKHAFGLVSANNVLFDPLFTPNGVWVQNDYLDSSSSVNLMYKGPGAVGNTGTKIDGTNVVNFGSFSLGTLVSRADLHFLNSSQANYSAFRTTDASGGVCVQICSYTGNGSNPRVITLTPTSEQVPLFVIVFPRNGNSVFFRDPSHTTNTSSDASSLGISTLAIQARGIDQITVNSALNVNGVIYDVFAFPGGDGTNGTYYPPNGPSPGPFPPVPPTIPPDVAIIGEGGIVFSGQPSLLLLQDVSGIYTLVPGKTDDTVYDRQTGQTSVHMKIPDPNVKTGFVGN